MTDTARKKSGRQEATAQLAFAAMIDPRATLHDAIVSAGMTVLGAMLEEERQSCVARATRTCRAESQRALDTSTANSPSADAVSAFGVHAFEP